MMDQVSYLNEIDKAQFPIINYRNQNNLGISIVNFFALAMGLYMFSTPLMGWIDYESPTLGTIYIFGGFCQYLIGFYDWYQGNSMLSFVDFVFALLHLAYYYTADLGKYSLWVPNEYHTYMQGVFFCIWLALLFILMISVKNKGCIHLLYLFLLGFAVLFLIVWEFGKKTWARKTAGYILFVASIFIWYAGLSRLVSTICNCDCCPLISPLW